MGKSGGWRRIGAVVKDECARSSLTFPVIVPLLGARYALSLQHLALDDLFFASYDAERRYQGRKPRPLCPCESS